MKFQNSETSGLGGDAGTMNIIFTDRVTDAGQNVMTKAHLQNEGELIKDSHASGYVETMLGQQDLLPYKNKHHGSCNTCSIRNIYFSTRRRYITGDDFYLLQ